MVEHGQNAIIQRNLSYHQNLQGLVPTSRGSTSTSKSNRKKHQRTPFASDMTSSTPTTSNNNDDDNKSFITPHLPAAITDAMSCSDSTTTPGENDPLLPPQHSLGLSQRNNGRDDSLLMTTFRRQGSNLTNTTGSLGSLAFRDTRSDYAYENDHTIRFQVVVWHVGAIDVIQGRVPMTFRVTLFWNDLESCASLFGNDTDNAKKRPTTTSKNAEVDDNASLDTAYTTASTVATSRRLLQQQQHLHWSMRGRNMAVAKSVTIATTVEASSDQPRQQQQLTGSATPTEHTVPVPSLSILNVVTFDTIGPPEVDLLNAQTGLWRWTCMYRATLLQDHWRVHDFPHDHHVITLKLAVLAHRRVGAMWDRSVWKLSTATAADAAGSTRDPAGLLVDQVKIPEFSHTGQLDFDFVPLDHGQPGCGGGDNEDDDDRSCCDEEEGLNNSTYDDGEQCLHVKLHVQRDSYYYDRNIVPLLAMLNLVAITITALGAEDFFQRALLTLNIAFVEISIRMTTDKHLPSVAYQIKLQRVLNEYFFGLLFLVLESNLVYELHRYGYGHWTGPIDAAAAFSVWGHNAWTLFTYYAQRNLDSEYATNRKRGNRRRRHKVR